MVWKCLDELSKLGKELGNSTASYGTRRNEIDEITDSLSKKGAGIPFAGLELFCGISSSTILDRENPNTEKIFMV